MLTGGRKAVTKLRENSKHMALWFNLHQNLVAGCRLPCDPIPRSDCGVCDCFHARRVVKQRCVLEISPGRLDFEERQRAVAGVVRLEGRQGKVAIAFETDLGRTRTGGFDCRLIPHYSASRSVESAGIAGLDPAIYLFRKEDGCAGRARA